MESPYEGHSPHTKVEKFNKSFLSITLKATASTRDISAVNFYTALQVHAQGYGIGLKPFALLGPMVTDYYQPSNASMPRHQQQQEREIFAGALGPKIIAAIEDEGFRTAMLSQLASKNDGYELLYNIMTFHLPQLKRVVDPMDYAKVTERPKHSATESIFDFSSRLQTYYQIQSNMGHSHEPLNIASVFISEMEKDTRYALAVREAKDKLKACTNGTVPPEYEIGRIAYTMASYAKSQSNIDFDVFATINESAGAGDIKIGAAEANPTNKRYEHPRDNSRRPPQRRNSWRRRRQQPDIQCTRCMAYGHSGSDCTFFPRVWWCAHIIQKEMEASKTIAATYRDKNTPKQKAAERTSITKAFMDATGETGEPDTFTGETLDRYETFLDSIAHIGKAHAPLIQSQETPVKHKERDNNHAATPNDPWKHLEQQVAKDIDRLLTKHTGSTMTSDITELFPHIPRALTAITVPPMPTYLTEDHEMETPTDVHEADTIQQSNITPEQWEKQGTPMICISSSAPHTLQSDTGANRNITDDKSLLTNFQEIKPFSIGTINSSSTVQVTGKGEMVIPTTNGKSITTSVYYSADASGSVFSPDRFVDETPGFYTWAQLGCPSQGLGHIWLIKEDGTDSRCIPLHHRNNLWYMRVTKPDA